MKTELLIAWRYLFARKSHNVINVISFISAAGMAVGTAALILILSVYNGFSKIITDNLADIDADLRIESVRGRDFQPDSLEAAIISADGVRSVIRTLEFSAFAKCDGKESVIRIKGADDNFISESGIGSHLLVGKANLHKGELDQLLIGAGIASELETNPRFLSPVVIYYPERNTEISITNPLSSLNSVQVYTSGIFSINSELDATLGIIPLKTAHKLYGDERVSALEMRLDEDSDIKTCKKTISSIVGPDYCVLDRYEQHGDLYKMMKTEKAAVFIILSLVVLIVALNIFGSLSMLVIEKKEDIGTLISMGADRRMTKRIFVLEGWMVSVLGMATGLIVGIGLSLAQQEFGIVRMPGNYLVSFYPVLLQWSDVAVSALAISAIGLAVAAAVPVKSED